MKKSNS